MTRILLLLALLPSLAFGQVLRRDGSTGTFSVPATGPSFTATAASGNNGLACQQNGCRVDFGAGASDYASSDGTTVTFAGPVGATSLTTSAASGATAIAMQTGSKIYYSSAVYATATIGTYTLTGNFSTSGNIGTASGSYFYGGSTGTIYSSSKADAADAVAHSFRSSASLVTAGAQIATFAPDSTPTVKASIDKDGTYRMDGTDASGTPGAATINQPIGQVSVDDTAASVVVTNSLVTTASVILPVLQFVDATCTQILSCVPAAGSFTITMNAACTAHTKIGFVVHNYF